MIVVEAGLQVVDDEDEFKAGPDPVDLAVSRAKRDWIGDAMVVVGLAVAANLYLVSALVR